MKRVYFIFVLFSDFLFKQFEIQMNDINLNTEI